MARGGLPRFAGAVGALPRRSPFLNGTYKAYFGSGQAPDGMTDSDGYRQPVDWPDVGSLLRPPQQVWLSLDPVDVGIQPYIDVVSTVVTPLIIYQVQPGDGDYASKYIWTDGHEENADPADPSEPQTQPGTGGYTTEVSPGNWTVHNYQPPVDVQHTVSNYSDQENARLRAVFLAAQAKILAIRRGRTWVDFIDYNSPNPAKEWPNNTTPTGSFPNLVNRYEHVVAPNKNDKFFGTDFLHVYCGYPVTPFHQNLTDARYVNSKGLLKGSYKLFAGYSTQLYTIGSSGQQQAVAAEPIIPVPGAPPGVLLQDHSATITASNVAIAAGNAAFNAKITGYGPTTATYFRAIAADLKDYGFKYAGDSSLLSSSAALVRLVADHFNFDPDTGADL